MLTVQTNSVCAWNTDGTSGDQVVVNGVLNLPATASVNISNIAGNGQLPPEWTLFSATSLTGASSLSAWTFSDARYRAFIRGTEVVMSIASGTIVSIW